MRAFLLRVQPARRPAGIALALVLAMGGLSGCRTLLSSDDTLLGLITPYRVEVVQGNVLTQEQVAQVKPGMTRTQVRDVLGSPLLTDPFHADRWDYVFTIRRQGTEPQQRTVVAYFEGEALSRIEGAESLPNEREFVDSIDNSRAPRNTRPLALTPEQMEKLPVPPAPAASAAAPEGPARTYPPLERS